MKSDVLTRIRAAETAAERKVDNARKKADEMLHNARIEAHEIVEHAKKQSDQIIKKAIAKVEKKMANKDASVKPPKFKIKEGVNYLVSQVLKG